MNIETSATPIKESLTGHLCLSISNNKTLLVIPSKKTNSQDSLVFYNLENTIERRKNIPSELPTTYIHRTGALPIRLPSGGGFIFGGLSTDRGCLYFNDVWHVNDYGDLSLCQVKESQSENLQTKCDCHCLYHTSSPYPRAHAEGITSTFEDQTICLIFGGIGTETHLSSCQRCMKTSSRAPRPIIEPDFLWGLITRKSKSRRGKYRLEWRRFFKNEQNGSNWPSPRFGHSMVSDPHKKLSGWLYGGWNGETCLNDLWFIQCIDNHIYWSEYSSNLSPPRLYRMSGVFLENHYLLFYGGVGNVKTERNEDFILVEICDNFSFNFFKFPPSIYIGGLSFHQMIKIEDYIYIVGGYNGRQQSQYIFQIFDGNVINLIEKLKENTAIENTRNDLIEDIEEESKEKVTGSDSEVTSSDIEVNAINIGKQNVGRQDDVNNNDYYSGNGSPIQSPMSTSVLFSDNKNRQSRVRNRSDSNGSSCSSVVHPLRKKSSTSKYMNRPLKTGWRSTSFIDKKDLPTPKSSRNNSIFKTPTTDSPIVKHNTPVERNMVFHSISNISECKADIKNEVIEKNDIDIEHNTGDNNTMDRLDVLPRENGHDMTRNSNVMDTPNNTMNNNFLRRTGQLAFYLDNFIYIFGGVSDLYVLNDWRRYSKENHVLECLTESCGILSPRSGMKSVSLNGSIYLFGGSDNASEIFMDMYMINPKNKSNSNLPFEITEITTTFKNTTVQITPPRIDFGICSDGISTIYIHGGRDRHSKRLSDLWSYSIMTGEWSLLSNSPPPLIGHSLSYFQHGIYLYGGWDGRKTQSYLYVYDCIRHDGWKRLDTEVWKRLDTEGVSKVGIEGVCSSGPKAGLTMESSDQIKNSKTSPTPCCRYRHAQIDPISVLRGEHRNSNDELIIKDGNGVYSHVVFIIFGGVCNNGDRLSDSWLLTVRSNKYIWRKLDYFNHISPRSFHSLVLTDDSLLFILCGYSERRMNDVYCINLNDYFNIEDSGSVDSPMNGYVEKLRRRLEYVEQVNLCKICFVNDISAVLLNCAHRVACVKCSKSLKICPICRSPVEQVLVVYNS